MMCGCRVFIDILEWDELEEEDKRGEDAIFFRCESERCLLNKRRSLII